MYMHVISIFYIDILYIHNICIYTYVWPENITGLQLVLTGRSFDPGFSSEVTGS